MTKFATAWIGLVAAAALCGATGTAATEIDGRAAFEARCGDCHGPRDIAYWGRQRPDADERAAWLDRFLQRHYPPPDVERAAIIRHIEQAIADPPARR